MKYNRALLKRSDFFGFLFFFTPPLQGSKQNTFHFTEKEAKSPVISVLLVVLGCAATVTH